MNWLLKFGSRLRMEELHRLHQQAEGKPQCANLALVEKSSIPAPSIEIANDDPPHSQCTSTALTATAEDTIPPTAISGSQTSCQPHSVHKHADPCEPVDPTLRTDVHAAITDTPLRTPPCDSWTPPTPLRTPPSGQPTATQPQRICTQTPHASQAEWPVAEERQLERESSHGVEADDMRLGEGLSRATWGRRLEKLDPIDLIKALTITVPTQRHIPKSFQGPFRAILMDMLSMAQQTGDWRTRERAEKLLLLLPRRVLRAPPPPERRARNKEAYTMHRFQKSLQGKWSELLEAEEREGRRSLPQMETPAEKASKIIGAPRQWELDEGHCAVDLLRSGAEDGGHSEHDHGDAQTQRRPAFPKDLTT